MTKQFSKEGQFSGVLCVYKRPGETPLECLERLRQEKPELKDVPLSYMGRLDPLASGVLVVVAGEENKQRDKYLKLPKEYKIEVLLGVSTDTYDVLGLITEHASDYQTLDEEQIKKVLKECEGEMTVPYPLYSSKPVSGKPLFAWAREGKADDIEIPETKLKISSIKYEGRKTRDASDIHAYINELIGRVNGDFRQSEILDRWNGYFKSETLPTFDVLTLVVQCESGSYMRSLAVEIGKRLGVPALALSIERTRVGDFTLSTSESH